MKTGSVDGHANLLHGLGRSPTSMRAIERLLSAHGYRVLNLGYPSRSASIPELADLSPRWPVVGPVYRRLTGPAGVQLGTGSSSVPAKLPRFGSAGT